MGSAQVGRGLARVGCIRRGFHNPLLNWGRQILPDKNALAQEDARAIEATFQAKIGALESSDR